jgi:hypothetical protein
MFAYGSPIRNAVSLRQSFRPGEPLGHAVREARRPIMARNGGNSTWPAYHLNGNPECPFGRRP